MTHLSPLVLDEAASGDTLQGEHSQHLASCELCRERIAALRKANEAILSKAPAMRQLTHLTAQPPARRRLKLSWVSAGLAAALLLLVLNGRRHTVSPTDVTLKGAATVELLDARGTAVTRASAQTQLRLAVGGAGHQYVAVFAIDHTRVPTALVPTEGLMRRLAGGARESLMVLDVTPGDTVVIAFFADEPAPIARYEARLREALLTTAPEALRFADASVTRLQVDATP